MTKDEGSREMPDQFILRIDLGNEAMQDGDDVAFALSVVAQKLTEGYTSGRVVDANGNTVGNWVATFPELAEIQS